MPLAAILSQGDEVVTGQVVDTNAAWLAERLTELGFDVVEHVAVRDVASEIEHALSRLAERVQVVVCTGGLGPTADDLTAQAVASAFSRPLVVDEHALQHIRDRYARYARTMPVVNEKQAWLPTGCDRLDNDWGTAPGFLITQADCSLFFIPGVPSEMRALWTHRVLPRLTERFPIAPGLLITLFTTGIGESNLQERIGSFNEPDVALSFRTKLPENHIKLRFRPGTASVRVEAVVSRMVGCIGSPIFAIQRPGEPLRDLAATVAHTLTAQGHTLAVAESCTGGLIASQLTALAGASAWFLEGAVTYANVAKIRTLGVSPESLDEHGAVSEVVARQMATGMQARCDSTWALSSTGIAGPTGGTDDKPVGTVHIGLAAPNGQVHHRLLHLGGDRRRIQLLTAGAALDLLRRAQQSLL